MSLSPADYRKTEFIHRIGLASARPAAADVLVGTLYFASDTGIMTRSNGISWDTYGGGSSIAPSGGQIFLPGSDGEDGRDGFPGPQGIQGNQGAMGIPGFAGLDGEDGLSGYNFPPYVAPTEFTITSTGTQNDLDYANAGILRCNNATLLTITGLKPGGPGQRLTIKSVGAGQVNLLHQNAGSLAGNRLINFATSGITPLAAGTGTAILEYDSTTLRWRLTNHNQGAWIDIPYNAGDFAASSPMVWTVDSADLKTYRIWLKERTLFINLAITGSSLTGTPTAFLLLTLPGFSTAGFLSFNVVLNVSENGGSPQAGEVVTNIGSSSQIQFWKLTEINWILSTNNMALFGTFPIEIL